VFRDRSVPRLLLLALAVTLAVTVVVVAGTSASSFSAYNTDWNGTSEMRSSLQSTGTQTTVARGPATYDTVGGEGTVAFVLSPSEPERGERTALREHIRDGGTLVVADDYGSGGNDVLAAVGAEARISGVPLRDERRAGPSPAFPRATAATNHTYTRNVSGLMLNHGSVVTPGNATTLYRSSGFGYLDRNRNQELDADESLQRYPVVTVEQVGNGTVLTVSDPSIFLNSMLDRSDNGGFLRAVGGSHERAVVGVSRARATPPLIRLQVFFQQSGLGVIVAGTVSTLLLFTLSTRPDLRSKLVRRGEKPAAVPRLTREDIAETISERHPDWDAETVQQVTNNLISYRRQTETND